MKRIPLTQGKFAIVDDEDYERLSKYKWFVHKGGNAFYAARTTSRKLGKQKQIFMHREIMDAQPGEEIDHCNHGTLDNCKINLRFCSRSQNLQNQRKTRGSSEFKGVYWNKKGKKWVAQIRLNHKAIYLGWFDNEIKAAKMYDCKAKELFGEFANANF